MTYVAGEPPARGRPAPRWVPTRSSRAYRRSHRPPRQDATCYVGNLDEGVDEELLWELMVQAGPVVSVFMPKDKVLSKHMGYGFVEYRSEEDAEYAIKVMNMIKLFGRPLRINKSSTDKQTTDIGANLFIGNLASEVDEKTLYDTFSAFGGILNTPRVQRDMETGISKGFGFVQFDSFEASDMAIECMNGQWLCNRQIVVQYAFKRDSRERHGSQAGTLPPLGSSCLWHTRSPAPAPASQSACWRPTTPTASARTPCSRGRRARRRARCRPSRA